MISFSVPPDLYRLAHLHLADPVEGVGFFLADYLPETRVFRFRGWRSIPFTGFESRSDYHLVLADDLRAQIIKWAWDSGASLVEAHSHDLGLAQFSQSDVCGLREWVPHVWWRLRGRPYGAIVVDGETLDALAWLESDNRPEQVTSIDIDHGDSISATGLTLPELTRYGMQT